MNLYADLTEGVLEYGAKMVSISCQLRVDRKTGSDLIVLSIPDKKPIMPQIFPRGTWEVYKPLKRESDYLAPYFIPTSAFQNLPIWALDDENCYLKATKEKIRDEGYGLHYSTSKTTQGCIKITKKIDLLDLANALFEAFDKEEKCFLEVV